MRLLDPLSGQTFVLHAPGPAEASAPPWRTTLWRLLDPAPRRGPCAALEARVARASWPEVRAWLRWRSTWAAAVRPAGPAQRRPRDRRLAAALEFAVREPALGALIAASGPPRILPKHPSTFATLARAIAYQQLSGKAAATIWGRVCALFPEATPEARALLRKRAATLRACGLSAAKVLAVRDLADHVERGELDPASLSALGDDEVIERLTRVRGIGPWSAQMHLMFALERPDVWPVGDLGVQKGVARWKGLAVAPGPKELEVLGEAYRPHRSLAAWYAWRALEIGFP